MDATLPVVDEALENARNHQGTALLVFAGTAGASR
jgi:hypothetical protein